jgi:1-acyl-sn-glycerol-3-phosphate acyltransferase
MGKVNLIMNIEDIKKIFSQNSYISENNIAGKKTKSSFISNFSFYWAFAKEVFFIRKLVLKNNLHPETVVEHCFNVFKAVEKAGGIFDIKGLDNLRKEPGPFVVVGNHMSTLETVVFPCVIGNIIKLTYIVKKSLTTSRLFGPVMRFFDPIAVERKDARKDLDTVLSKGQELLAKGISVLLFPQSTRTKEFDPQKFNSLGIKLAKRANVKIIPLALKTDFWENGKIISTIGNLFPERIIHIEFGSPVTIEGAGKKEHEDIINFIKSRFDVWK